MSEKNFHTQKAFITNVKNGKEEIVRQKMYCAQPFRPQIQDETHVFKKQKEGNKQSVMRERDCVKSKSAQFDFCVTKGSREAENNKIMLINNKIMLINREVKPAPIKNYHPVSAAEAIQKRRYAKNTLVKENCKSLAKKLILERQKFYEKREFLMHVDYCMCNDKITKHYFKYNEHETRFFDNKKCIVNLRNIIKTNFNKCYKITNILAHCWCLFHVFCFVYVNYCLKITVNKIFLCYVRKTNKHRENISKQCF